MKKVMIIDDSAVICQAAEMFLQDQYEVVSASDGFEALSAIVEEKPDIVFIDVLMPKLDGLKTCQLIKSNDLFKDLPVIILSSKDGAFDKARGMFVGASDYITKPFTKESILEKIKLHLKD